MIQKIKSIAKLLSVWTVLIILAIAKPLHSDRTNIVVGMTLAGVITIIAIVVPRTEAGVWFFVVATLSLMGVYVLLSNLAYERKRDILGILKK